MRGLCDISAMGLNLISDVSRHSSLAAGKVEIFKMVDMRDKGGLEEDIDVDDLQGKYFIII